MADLDQNSEHPDDDDIEKANRERVMTYLLMRPYATLEQMLTELDLKLWDVRKAKTRLQDIGFLKKGWFPSRKMIREYQQFFVFVETSFDRDGKEPRKGQGYQELIREEIQETLKKKGAPAIVLSEVEVLLGGPFDMLIRLFSKDVDAVHRWVADELRSIDHIHKSSSAWARKFLDDERDE